jgi:hypothetical protein
MALAARLRESRQPRQEMHRPTFYFTRRLHPGRRVMNADGGVLQTSEGQSGWWLGIPGSGSFGSRRCARYNLSPASCRRYEAAAPLAFRQGPHILRTYELWGQTSSWTFDVALGWYASIAGGCCGVPSQSRRRGRRDADASGQPGAYRRPADVGIVHSFVGSPLQNVLGGWSALSSRR